mgnify:CR=1 FL=1
MNFEEIPEKEGLIIILHEKQEGVLTSDGREKESKTIGEIIIINNTGSPIYDLELHLSGVEKTDLEKKVSVGAVPVSKTGESKKVRYNVRDVLRAVEVREQIIFPEDIARPVALMGREIDLKMRYDIKNNTGIEFNVEFDKELPEQIIVRSVPSLAMGSIVTESGKVTLRDFKISGKQTETIDIDALILAEKEDAFRSGKVVYRYYGEGLTVSGLNVEEVTGLLNVRHYVDKNERAYERGVWDNYVIVENMSGAPIKVVAEISVISGKILTAEEGGAEIRGSIEWKIPGKRDYDTIIMEPVIVGPRETTKIGPFTLALEEEPKISTNLRIWIIPEVIRRVSGNYTIEDFEIPVVWGRITKEVLVEHPPYIKGMTPHNLVGHLEEPVNVKIVVENLGSATLDQIVIKDKIPADFKPPRVIDIKTSLIKGGGEITIPSEMLKVSLEPTDTDPSKIHDLRIEIFGVAYNLGEPLLKGESVIVNYKLLAVDPKPGVTYEFPAEAELAMTADTRPIEISLEEVPKLETLAAVRKITKSKEVNPSEIENEYIVVVILRNEGDLPVQNYKHIEQIPPTFEFAPENAEPVPESMEEIVGGLLEVRWIISEIPAKSEYKILYKVKGKPGHKVADLLRLIE